MILIKLLLAATVLVTFLGVWKMESGRRLILTPFLLVAYFELVRVLPAFFLADTREVTQSALPLIAAVLAYLGVLAGFVFSYGYSRTSRQQTLVLTQENLALLPWRRGDYIGVAAISVLVVCSGLMLYRGLPPVGEAVAAILFGGGSEAADYVSQQRFELTKGAYFGEEYRGQGAFRVVQQLGWAMLVGYAMLRFIERKSVVRAAWLVASFFGAWIFLAGDGTRGPFLNLIISVVALYSLRKPLKFRTMVALFAAGVCLAIALSLYSNKMYGAWQSEDGNFLAGAVSKIFERLFIANGMNDVRVLDMVNEGELQLRWGATHLRDLISAIPGVEYGVPLSHELFTILNPSSRGTTFFSGTYLSDVYIDFGWFGLFPIFFVAGAAVGQIQRRLFNVSHTHWQLAVHAVVAFTGVTILRSGFVGFGVIMAVILILHSTHWLVASTARRLAWRSAPVRLASGLPPGRRNGDVPPDILARINDDPLRIDD